MRASTPRYKGAHTKVATVDGHRSSPPKSVPSRIEPSLIWTDVSALYANPVLSVARSRGVHVAPRGRVRSIRQPFLSIMVVIVTAANLTGSRSLWWPTTWVLTGSYVLLVFLIPALRSSRTARGLAALLVPVGWGLADIGGRMASSESGGVILGLVTILAARHAIASSRDELGPKGAISRDSHPRASVPLAHLGIIFVAHVWGLFVLLLTDWKSTWHVTFIAAAAGLAAGLADRPIRHLVQPELIREHGRWKGVVLATLLATSVAPPGVSLESQAWLFCMALVLGFLYTEPNATEVPRFSGGLRSGLTMTAVLFGSM